MEFNLRELHTLHPVITERRARLVVAGILVALILVTGDVLYVTARKGWVLSGGGLLAFSFFFDCALVLMLLVLSPQPDELQVDSAGLRLNFSAGRSISYRWNDRKFLLRMRSTKGAPDSLSKGQPVFLIRGFRPVRMFIPSEAFHRIVAEAHKQNLSVETFPSSLEGWTDLVVSARTGTNPLRPQDTIAVGGNPDSHDPVSPNP